MLAIALRTDVGTLKQLELKQLGLEPPRLEPKWLRRQITENHHMLFRLANQQGIFLPLCKHTEPYYTQALTKHTNRIYNTDMSCHEPETKLASMTPTRNKPM